MSQGVASRCRFKQDIDDYGRGNRELKTGVQSKEECCAFCEGQPGCAVALYIASEEVCWLKGEAGPSEIPRTVLGVVSCVLLPHGQPAIELEKPSGQPATSTQPAAVAQHSTQAERAEANVLEERFEAQAATHNVAVAQSRLVVATRIGDLSATARCNQQLADANAAAEQERLEAELAAAATSQTSRMGITEQTFRFGDGHHTYSILDRGSVQCVVCCIVLSAPGNLELRQTIRDTWGRRCDSVFLVGGESQPLDYNKGDVLYVAGPEVYNDQGKYSSVAMKVVAGMYFFVASKDRYPVATHLFKIDDDSFLDTERLEQVLRPEIPYWGFRKAQVQPTRLPWSRFFVAKESFPDPVYPEYAAGCGYALGVQSGFIECGVEKYRQGQVPTTPMEDVNTGILAAACGVQLQAADEGAIVEDAYQKNSDYRISKELGGVSVIVEHKVKTADEMLRRWKGGDMRCDSVCEAESLRPDHAWKSETGHWPQCSESGTETWQLQTYALQPVKQKVIVLADVMETAAARGPATSNCSITQDRFCGPRYGGRACAMDHQYCQTGIGVCTDDVGKRQNSGYDYVDFLRCQEVASNTMLTPVGCEVQGQNGEFNYNAKVATFNHLNHVGKHDGSNLSGGKVDGELGTISRKMIAGCDSYENDPMRIRLMDLGHRISIFMRNRLDGRICWISMMASASTRLGMKHPRFRKVGRLKMTNLLSNVVRWRVPQREYCSMCQGFHNESKYEEQQGALQEQLLAAAAVEEGLKASLKDALEANNQSTADKASLEAEVEQLKASLGNMMHRGVG